MVEQAHQSEALTMKINGKKCGATGMLYTYIKSGLQLLDSALSRKGIQIIRMESVPPP